MSEHLIEPLIKVTVMKKALTLAITLALLGGCKQESGTKTGDSIPYTGPVWA
ncbi:MAG: putative lipoprotein YajG, partial [Colwellia sp.]